MLPALSPGDRLLVDPAAYRAAGPRLGDVVVLHDPEERDRLLVKRVGTAPDGTGRSETVYVVGDAPGRSRDSRTFGSVPRGAIVGRAWFRYLPVDRRGRIAGDHP
jgi:signal peptidase I